MTERHILMADDDADDRFLVKAAFEDNEILNPIMFFEDGERLLEYLAIQSNKTAPLLIFLDLNMPKLDGREVLQAVRTDNKWSTIPIIIFSTSNAPEDIRAAYELGANSYIVKPSSYDGLKEVILNVQNFWLHTATLPK